MNRRIALSFLFIMLSIGSIVAENVQANQLEYLNNTVIASLKTNEIFIEGLLLPIEDRNTNNALMCQGKYVFGEKSIIQVSGKTSTVIFDGTITRTNKGDIAMFSGHIKTIAQNGDRTTDIDLKDFQLKNGEEIPVARMDLRMEQEVDGKIKMSTLKWEIRIIGRWK